MVFSLGFTYIIFGNMYGVWNMFGGWDYSSRPNMLDSVWISDPYDGKMFTVVLNHDSEISLFGWW